MTETAVALIEDLYNIGIKKDADILRQGVELFSPDVDHYAPKKHEKQTDVSG